jgi:hypothetical protein
MSYLSQLKHGEITPAEFLARSLGFIRAAVGVPSAPAAADGPADRIETVKAEVERVVDAYLVAKLGAVPGGIAASIADGALNSIAVALETAAHTAAGK